MRQMVSYHLQHSFLRKFYCHFILCYISAMKMLKISVQNSGRDFDLTQLLRRFNNVKVDLGWEKIMMFQLIRCKN